MADGAVEGSKFDFGKLLTGRGSGQMQLHFAANEIVYRQGDKADAAFYVVSGKVKISAVVPSGKEAVVGMRGEGEFFGTRCLISLRAGTATALTDCVLIRITAPALARLLREEPDFAVLFATKLVRQSVSDQEVLVDHLINSAEKRLARTLLRLADFSGRSAGAIPAKVNQSELASMIGTTRSRVSFFMNGFRRRGLIEYDRHGHIMVRDALGGVVSG